MPEFSFVSRSPEQTQALAEGFGRLLEGGECLAFQGDLGTGKTCFVQGMAKGLDVPDSVYVRSPTFTLMDQYPGRMEVFHLDLYRLADEDELEAIGWRDCFGPDSVIAIEWAERALEALPSSRIDIILSHQDDDSRLIRFVWLEDAHPKLATWLESQQV